MGELLKAAIMRLSLGLVLLAAIGDSSHACDTPTGFSLSNYSSPINGICVYSQGDGLLISLDLTKVTVLPILASTGTGAVECADDTTPLTSFIDDDNVTDSRKSVVTQSMISFYSPLEKQGLWGVISGTFGGCAEYISHKDALPYSYKANGKIEFFGGSSILKGNDQSFYIKKFQRALAFNNDSSSARIIRHNDDGNGNEVDSFLSGEAFVSYFKTLAYDNVITGLSPDRLNIKSDFVNIGRNLVGTRNNELIFLIADNLSLEAAKSILVKYGVPANDIVQYDGSGSAQLVVEDKSSSNDSPKVVYKGDGRYLSNVFAIKAKNLDNWFQEDTEFKRKGYFDIPENAW